MSKAAKEYDDSKTYGKSEKGKQSYKGHKSKKPHDGGNRKKKSFDKDKVRGFERDQETSAEGDNNPKWYIPDEKVMETATRFSFSNFVGDAINFDPLATVAGLSDASVKPGAVMQILMNPCPGYTGISKANLAAVNQQAFRTYARLSSINAKNTNYSPNDVSTMILAMGELITLFAVAQRAYGLLWTYNVRNRTMPKMLLDKSGVDSAALSKMGADYLIRLNTIIVEANRIPFPSNIDYFNKCAEMYSSVYSDSESDMSELYVPLPYSIWELDETGSTEGTVLRTRKLWSSSFGAFTPLDPNDLLDLLEEQVENMLTSGTFNYIYSDILNLAAKDNNIKLLYFTPVELGYSVMPVYDKEFLLRINNSTILGEPLGTKTEMYLPDEHTISNDVYPDIDTMCLHYAPQFCNMSPVMGLQNIINFYDDNPSLEERIEATRYMNNASVVRYGLLKSKDAEVGSAITGYYYTDKVVALGDHYIVYVNVFTEGLEADMALDSSGFITNGGGYEGRISVLTRFGQFPYIYELTRTGTVETGTWDVVGLLGDIDFFTTVPADTLDNINKLALYGLYDVKDVTKL